MIPVRPRTLRLFLASVGFGATLALGAAGVARADGYLTDTERAYVYSYGATAICPVLEMYPSEAGVMGIASSIVDDGFTADAAVDIINASVANYCPSHWGLLEVIGAKARAENRGFRA